MDRWPAADVALYQRVIYFDYDRTEILPQFVDVLRAHYAASSGAAPR